MRVSKIYDLSVPLEESVSEPLGLEIVHLTHQDLAESLARFFNCSVDDFPDGLGYANDKIITQAHAGTHLDAPWHYYPTCEGKPSKTIDRAPLEWCIAPGFVLDMRHKEQGSGITIRDLEEAVSKIGYSIQPGDIALIMTGVDKYWGKKEYFDQGCGMLRDSTLWLIDQGVRVMGTDAWGWDRPLWAIAKEFEETGNKEILWAAHRVGMEKEYYHIEKLANLDTLPKPYGFTVSCLPIKLKNGSAGWCRAVAFYEE